MEESRSVAGGGVGGTPVISPLSGTPAGFPEAALAYLDEVGANIPAEALSFVRDKLAGALRNAQAEGVETLDPDE